VTGEQRPAGESAPRTPGERTIAAYLAERNMSARYEVFAVGANPDFVARHPIAGEIVFEVYEPEYRLPRNPDGSFYSGAVRSPGAVIQRGLNSARKHRQAKAARTRGLPFVLVIASTNSEIAFTEYDVPPALFGSLEFAWHDEPEPDSNESGQLGFGGGGRLQPRLNTSFSAVALIAPAADKGCGTGIKIFHNPFTALPVPAEFAGPCDEQWRLADSGQCYQKIPGGD
jgi:hypothetical protein